MNQACGDNETNGLNSSEKFLSFLNSKISFLILQNTKPKSRQTW
jgi:hypothetical protein